MPELASLFRNLRCFPPYKPCVPLLPDPSPSLSQGLGSRCSREICLWGPLTATRLCSGVSAGHHSVPGSALHAQDMASALRAPRQHRGAGECGSGHQQGPGAPLPRRGQLSGDVCSEETHSLVWSGETMFAMAAEGGRGDRHKWRLGGKVMPGYGGGATEAQLWGF